MEIKIIRSNRKSVALQIDSKLGVTMRVPANITRREIDKILKEKEGWILEHLEKAKVQQAEREANRQPRLTREELYKLADEATQYIPERVMHFAPIVGVSVRGITIRNQKTKWGSCSSKGNLNFNCLLMLTPPDVIDYVVVHELCHRLKMNHSREFWAGVKEVLPDYEKSKKWLRENGNAIMDRVRLR